MDTTRLLLQNGIKSMLVEEDADFQQNITQALALKLNDSISTIKKAVSEKIFEKSESTESSLELNEFLEFINSFKEGKYTFQDGSNININESQIESIKKLFESLNSTNRQLMVCEIFKSPATFKQHLDFATSTKGML